MTDPKRGERTRIDDLPQPEAELEDTAFLHLRLQGGGAGGEVAGKAAAEPEHGGQGGAARAEPENVASRQFARATKG